MKKKFSANARGEPTRSASASLPLVKLVIQVFILAAFLLPRFAFGQNLPPEQIYAKLLPSVMTLHVKNAQGESFVGTAFLALDKNIAVTAWHVICDATNVTAKFSDERVINVAGLIDKDEQHDLALIRLDAPERPVAPLCMAKPRVGSRAYVIGAPKGFDFSISDGLISQIQKIRGADEYQVSCPISGGNSGGPIINERGEVMGIAAWTQKDAQNVSFAIPSSFLERLNPKHSLITWDAATASATKNSTSPSQAVKSDETHGSVADLKRALKNSAGERVTITVSDGNGEKKFDVVLPKDFVR